MINGVYIYYSRQASGLKPVSTNKKQQANGLKPVSNKGGACKKIGKGLKILQ